MWNLKKKEMNAYNKTESDTENKLVVFKGERESGRDKIGVVD